MLMQIILSCIAGAIGASWTSSNLNNTYLKFKPKSEWETNTGLIFLQITGTLILIFTNFVPISLLISLEFVKFWQASFMNLDILMYDTNNNIQMSANSSSINEELG